MNLDFTQNNSAAVADALNRVVVHFTAAELDVNNNERHASLSFQSIARENPNHPKGEITSKLLL